MIKGKDSSAYHHVFQLYDNISGIKFTDLIEIHSLELKKVPMLTDNTKKYDWLRFLNAEKEDEFMIAAQKNPVIQKAFVELKRLSQDEEAQRQAENREKAIRDEYSRNKFAYDKGIKEGKKEGIKEGAKERELQIAREMLKDGLAPDKVARYTGFSEQELQMMQIQ